MTVTRTDRRRTRGDCCGPQRAAEHVRRAHIILATAEAAVPLRSCAAPAKSKPVVGDGRRDSRPRVSTGLPYKTRKPGKQPLPATVVQRVVDLTLGRHRAMQPTGPVGCCESGWREPAFGATHPRSAPTGAASRSHLQAVDRPEVRGEAQGDCSVSTSIRPPMRSFCRSMRRAKSRRSTAPSRGCR